MYTPVLLMAKSSITLRTWMHKYVLVQLSTCSVAAPSLTRGETTVAFLFLGEFYRLLVLKRGYNAALLPLRRASILTVHYCSCYIYRPG
jgi:hypothetical protein